MILHSPLEQFSINSLIHFELGNTSLSFTNSSLFMLIGCGLMYFFYSIAMHKATVIPNNWQSGVESVYEFVSNTLEQSIADEKTAGKYFPFMFFLFSFILFANLVGMVPYSFCVTSHLCVTFALGLTIWFGTTIIGFRTHGTHFFSLFMPSGAPFAIMPFLIGIELLSFIFKGVSISVRLFANMMAGHSLLKILAGFAWAMLSAGSLGIFGAGITLTVVLVITGLEFGIAFLQAYVFTMLSCMYLNDCIALH
jgi:ATP synthase subunit 6